jgi:hypothetical protein
MSSNISFTHPHASVPLSHRILSQGNELITIKVDSQETLEKVYTQFFLNQIEHGREIQFLYIHYTTLVFAEHIGIQRPGVAFRPLKQVICIYDREENAAEPQKGPPIYSHIFTVILGKRQHDKPCVSECYVGPTLPLEMQNTLKSRMLSPLQESSRPCFIYAMSTSQTSVAPHLFADGSLDPLALDRMRVLKHQKILALGMPFVPTFSDAEWVAKQRTFCMLAEEIVRQYNLPTISGK